ncbi:hypothetical protein FD41_GL000833 [Lentilactobacillus farraginis DSM 18382 = JCM 14108]|uniref:Uncharacterized protein n=1 Tax=Lentilactobacillus farraginis DSM 18382 = JCM 14108 TaxID=1423743 RepID=A0A0R1VN20_9LACO|nr:hypothetical protein FD41_GL000833 [Lentilactobacillus farraginis DSM 18382 = JCM 14108]
MIISYKELFKITRFSYTIVPDKFVKNAIPTLISQAKKKPVYLNTPASGFIRITQMLF